MALLANTEPWNVLSGASSIPIMDTDIKLDLTELNYATFISPTPLTINSSVILCYGNKQVFPCKVSQCKKLTRDVSGGGRYDIEVVEFAEELKYKYIMDNIYSGLFILNSNDNKTLGTYIATIIANTGWIDISDPSFKNLKMVSGATSAPIPSMGFSVSSVYNALHRIIVEVFGLGLWFDYTGGKKCIRYGEYNSTAYGFPVPTNVKISEKDIDYNVDGIAVYNSDGSLKSVQGDITGPRVLAYRYTQCQSQQELDWIAQQIFADRTNISTRWEIEFPAGWYDIHEGDLIDISDTLSDLPHIEGGHGVKDVEFKMDRTIIGIGAPKVTVFDIYKNKLSVIDGDILSYNPIELDIGNVSIACATNSGIYGAETVVKCALTGTTFLGDFIVEPKLYDSMVGGMTTFAIGAATSSMIIGATSSGVIIIGASSEIVDAASGDVVISYQDAMEEDWFPWSWQYAEIEVSYIFNSNNEVGSEISWHGLWDVLPMVDDGLSYQDASSMRRTITHKWRVNQQDNVLYSWPLIIVHQEVGTTPVEILNFTITLTIYYNEPETVNELSSDVYVQMKLDDYEWITIYDYSDPDIYLNVKYNLSTLLGLNNDNFNLADEHTFTFRCKGESSVVCNMNGSYLAFDESTRIET